MYGHTPDGCAHCRALEVARDEAAHREDVAAQFFGVGDYDPNDVVAQTRLAHERARAGAEQMGLDPNTPPSHDAFARQFFGLD